MELTLYHIYEEVAHENDHRNLPTTPLCNNSNMQDNNGDTGEDGTDSDSMSNDGQMSNGNNNSNKPMSAEERK